MSTLAIIPARGGSKGLPRKNVLPIAGKPLLAWTIEAALAAETVDMVVLSSDDQEIIDVAVKYGCDVPFERPADIATDEAPMIEVLHHAMDELKKVRDWDNVVLLQPTSPLRTSEDIDQAVGRCMANDGRATVGICEIGKPLEWLYKLGDGDGLQPAFANGTPINRRQDAERVYVPNGAIYVAGWDWIRNRPSFFSEDTIGYVMPQQRSVDIDSQLDFALAEIMLNAMH